MSNIAVLIPYDPFEQLQCRRDWHVRASYARNRHKHFHDAPIKVARIVEIPPCFRKREHALASFTQTDKGERVDLLE
ncbi:hypothetical protein D3C79_977750 [compost metagenome]